MNLNEMILKQWNKKLDLAAKEVADRVASRIIHRIKHRNVAYAGAKLDFKVNVPVRAAARVQKKLKEAGVVAKPAKYQASRGYGGVWLHIPFSDLNA